MIKRLRKVGNSNALILDRAIMELIGLEEDGAVELTVSDGSLIVTPAEPSRASQERFEESLNRVVRKRRTALRRLAR
jgi:antitoxin component of MazEF toxin-antitoxin module